MCTRGDPAERRRKAAERGSAGHLWAGTFENEIAPLVLEYTQTVDIDARLIEADLWVNIAHVLMLSRQSIIPQSDGRRMVAGLLGFLREADQGDFVLDKSLEDVHLNIEQRLIGELGLQVAGKLHAARSRNDQVAADTRLLLRWELLKIEQALGQLIRLILKRAAGSVDDLMVGYTHGQPAQPITVGFWFAGQASALMRDWGRFRRAYRSTNVNPLGCCALAGTSFPVDRDLTAELLGFDGPILHALDATSSRDYIAETIAAIALNMCNFSRLAEELIIWCGAESGLVRMHDSLSTGSSIMPQKRNPVVAELIRARTGRAYGALMHILTALKGVPGGYNCDLQEDKPPLWEALDVSFSTIEVMRLQIQAIEFDSAAAAAYCFSNFSTATELANHLVTHEGLSFRQAHQTVGRVAKELRRSDKDLAATALVQSLLKKSSGIEIPATTLASLLDPGQAVERQTSSGGTSSRSTKAVLERLQYELAEAARSLEKRLAKDRSSLEHTQGVARQFAEGAGIEELFQQRENRP